MKIENDDIICFRFKVVDKDQAFGFLDDLLDTMKASSVRGLRVTAVSLDDVFQQLREAQEELDKWEDDHGPFDCLHCEDDDGDGAE